MPTLYYTIGLPGAGKSTWAKQFQKDNPGVKRVNKDSLRDLLDGGVWSHENEGIVLRVRNRIIEESFLAGKSIIVDDTGFNKVHETQLRSLAARHGANFEIKNFTGVPLEVCIERDSFRQTKDRVGREVIEKMHRQYLGAGLSRTEVKIQKVLEPQAVESAPPFDPALPTAVLVDIDGTVALMGSRRGPFEWHKVGLDEPNVPVVDLVRTLLWSRDYAEDYAYSPQPTVIFMSGRDSACRAATADWIRKHVGDFGFALHMRPAGDMRKDSVVKLELYNQYIRGKFNVAFCLDDRKQVIDMYRSIGLTVLDVAGNTF